MTVPRLIIQTAYQTTLSDDIDDAVTTIPVVTVNNMVAGTYALIGDPNGSYEVILIGRPESGTQFIACTRGVDANHPAASHSTGDKVIMMGPFEPTDGERISTLEAGLSGIAPSPGITLYVSTNGVDTNDGLSWDTAKLTVQGAVDAASSLDNIYIGPGSYDENVTIPHSKPAITLTGAGPRGSVAIAPATGTGLLCRANDVTLTNVGLAALGTDVALILTGDRFRAYRCKLENDDGTGACLTIGPGTDANHTAHLDGSGSDALFYDCEFAWAATGVTLQGTDYGAATENVFRKCRFHNLGTAHITEHVGSGGSAAVTFATLLVERCVFQADEAGTIPTKFISLNASNSNTGQVTQCSFPVAIDSGKNLVSTKLLWVGNYHTGGLSAAQPS